MRTLVDTCVWAHFLRRKPYESDRVTLELERLIRADRVQLLGPIRQELLSGARPQEHFSQLKTYLRYYPNLRLDEQDDETAAEYYNLCRKRGVQGTTVDLLICAASVRHNLRIFTTDSDFVRFAEYLPIRLHPFR